MGTRIAKLKDYDYPHNERQYRLVYWDDGSVWDESRNSNNQPRPIEEGEMWIAEAVQRFRQLLAGKSAEFDINFLDGNKFVGKLVRANRHVSCAEGNYLLVVHLKGEKEPKRGWTGNFKPTKETPDVVQYVIKHFARSGKEVERIEIKKCKTEKSGKKWSGVFFHSSR
jgi:hypothetical protein